MSPARADARLGAPVGVRRAGAADAAAVQRQLAQRRVSGAERPVEIFGEDRCEVVRARFGDAHDFGAAPDRSTARIKPSVTSTPRVRMAIVDLRGSSISVTMTYGEAVASCAPSDGRSPDFEAVIAPGACRGRRTRRQYIAWNSANGRWMRCRNAASNVDALAEIAQQVGDRKAAGFVEQPARRERAGRVGELRLRAGEAAEPRLRARAAATGARAARSVCSAHSSVAGFERGGEPFVQPRRHAARGERADQRVGELVRRARDRAPRACSSAPRIGTRMMPS